MADSMTINDIMMDSMIVEDMSSMSSMFLSQRYTTQKTPKKVENKGGGMEYINDRWTAW